MVDGKFLAFGELLVRLSPPPPELLLQRPTLTAWLAGAEANVATALAKLGHQVAFVSQVPDNDLGRTAKAQLSPLRPRRSGTGTNCSKGLAICISQGSRSRSVAIRPKPPSPRPWLLLHGEFASRSTATGGASCGRAGTETRRRTCAKS